MFSKTLCKISILLEDAGIAYMIFGGQAVLLWGEARLTEDIDITVGLSPNEATTLLPLLAKDFDVLVENPIDFLSKTFVLPVFDRKNAIRLDLVFAQSKFELHALDNAVVREINGMQIRFINLEDLVILKLFACRPRDLEDVHSLLRKNKNIRFDYIDSWLVKFDAELETDLVFQFNKVKSELDY